MLCKLLGCLSLPVVFEFWFALVFSLKFALNCSLHDEEEDS